MWANCLTYAQNTRSAVVLEIGGQGLSYSLNYEYSFSDHLKGRIGISFLNIKENETGKTGNLMSFPLSLSYVHYLDDNDQHGLEFGLGTMNLLTKGNLVEYKGTTDFFINPNLILAYRYRSQSGDWWLRTAFTPYYGTTSMINSEGNSFQAFGSQFQPWGGLSLGYTL